jgi:hypothetical protein
VFDKPSAGSVGMLRAAPALPALEVRHARAVSCCPSMYGYRRGMTVPGTTVDYTEEESGLVSPVLDGSASAEVQNDAVLHFRSSVDVEMAVRPQSIRPATLGTKRGAWQRRVQSEGHIGGEGGLQFSVAEGCLPVCHKEGRAATRRIERPGWTPDLIQSARRAREQLGDRVLEAAVRVEATLGEDIAARLMQLLGELSDDTLEILKDSGELEQCLDNIGCLVRSVPDKELARRVLDNEVLRGRAYTIPELLADLAGSGFTERNARKVLSRLLNPKEFTAKGGCYEVHAAAWIKHNRNESVLACDGRMARRSYDFKTSSGNVYQVKFSRAAHDTLEREVAWCRLAVRETSEGSFGQVKWIVPDRAEVSRCLMAWFATLMQLTGEEIEVIEVPFAW